MTACWCRLTQPEKRRRKKANGGGSGSMAEAWPRGRSGARGASLGYRRPADQRGSRGTSLLEDVDTPIFGDPSWAEFSHLSGSVPLTQTRRSMTQKNRSPEVSRGRGWRRDRTVSCCHSARFSSARSLRKRQTARSQRSMTASRSSTVPVVTRTVYSGLFRLPTPRFSRTWSDCGERQEES